jgi:hypothetical protein
MFGFCFSFFVVVASCRNATSLLAQINEMGFSNQVAGRCNRARFCQTFKLALLFLPHIRINTHTLHSSHAYSNIQSSIYSTLSIYQADNIQALRTTGGNVEQAINVLLGGM